MATDDDNVNLTGLAAEHGLKRVGARPGLKAYLRQVWERRDFVLTLACSRVQATTQQDRLGIAWLFITPLLDALVYGVVFGVLQGSKKPDYFILFLLIGIFFFRYFTDCLSKGSQTIIQSRALVQSLSFPRMVLPLAKALEYLLNFIPVLGLLLVLCLLLGVFPTWHWLYLLPALLLWVLFNTGTLLLVARLTVYFRDINRMIPFTTRFLRYFSGVFYAPGAFVAGYPIIMMAFNINPVYDLLELVRFALIPGYSISQTLVVSGVCWAVGIFIVGAVFFWVAEESYGRVT